MRIYFLGREKSTRSYNRQYFYVFFGVVKQTRKSDTLKHSSLSFKLHKNERPEKEKRVLRICSFFAVVHWVIFELGIRFTWVGSSLPPSHDYFLEFILRRLVTLPVIHGVWCLFRRVNVAESYYLISQLAWKLSALILTPYPVLRTRPPVSVQLWSLHHLPLFRVDWWRIHQGLPSTDFFLSTSTHYPGMKSRNLSLFWYLGNHSSSLVVFLVAVSGFHYWSLLSRFLSCSTSSSFIHMGWNVPGLMALKTLGYQETILLSSLLPGCDWSYVSLTLVYIGIIDPQCTWSWLWSSPCRRSTLYVWWLRLSWFILSWIHICIPRGHDLVNGVQHGSAMYYWQLCLVVISEYIYQSAKGHLLYRDWLRLHFIILRFLFLINNNNNWSIKYFGHHTYLLTSHFRGHLL